MGIQMGVFLTYVGAIVLIFLVGKIFLWPLKLILKLAASSLLGGLAILLINALGAGFGVFIPAFDTDNDLENRLGKIIRRENTNEKTVNFDFNTCNGYDFIHCLRRQ